jgi:hypothetical protein
MKRSRSFWRNWKRWARLGSWMASGMRRDLSCHHDDPFGGDISNFFSIRPLNIRRVIFHEGARLGGDAHVGEGDIADIITSDAFRAGEVAII